MSPVGDERPGSLGEGLGLRDVVDMLRDDAAGAELRGQQALNALESRVMAAIGGVDGKLGKYIEVHAGDHLAMKTTQEVANARFDAFIASNQLEQARRDGALGVVRYLVELFGRNWKAMLPLAGAVAALTGAVHISIGVGA